MNRRGNSAAAKNIRRIMHPRKQPGKGKQPCQACHPPASGHTIPQKLKGHGCAVHGMIARKRRIRFVPCKIPNLPVPGKRPPPMPQLSDSKGNHEFLYDLGFDASEEFHTYGFDWQSDSITWYVDGEAVYTATENIPSNPGKIMMNVWPGTGVDGWLNAFDGTVPLTAEYKSVDFAAAEEG